ncbi:YiiX family permuted papain-like enzyme [Flavobacterium sp.]|uniref:YiiX family permuted papain-like enzyme n=1 Tax=Flavobacterium sp. TaxID=239 RepID=UPI00286D7DDD|nr:YiiX family permuted papain-like enzyme [Flavobacterium sp.]
MKATKIIFAIVTLGISFYFALKIVNSVFEKKNQSSNKIAQSDSNNIQDGDIIFQTSESSQCEAVRIATNSKFSHCGIIYIIDGKQFVYEAVQPVKLTKIDDWITHGKDNKYVIKRIKNASTILTPSIVKNMKNYGQQFNNKNYDLYFEWSDDKIYCSELIWKIYKNGAGIELCKLEKLKHFNLKNKTVQTILKERYGNNIPLEEAVVAPSQIVDSEILETVIDTY